MFHLKETFKDPLVQLPDHLRTNQKLKNTNESIILNTDRDQASTTPLGSLFHCLITLKKKFFLVPSLNLPWCRVVSFLCIPSSAAREKRPAPSSPLSLLRNLQRATQIHHLRSFTFPYLGKAAVLTSRDIYFLELQMTEITNWEKPIENTALWYNIFLES